MRSASWRAPVRTAEPLGALLACLRGAPPPEADWPAILVAANRALVTGILADRLGEAAPAEVRTFLAAVRARVAERNARLDVQLDEAVAALGRAGIRPILLKGAAVLRTAGPGYGGRLLSDLDLMVPGEALGEATTRLRALGYGEHAPPSHPLAARALSRAQDVGMIDLHAQTKVRHPGFAYADLAPDCTDIHVGDGRALLPAPTAQALVLILHDQLQERDYWRGLLDLRHLLDLAALAEAGLDWAWLAARFPPGYPRRALATQLATLAGLFGTRVPPGFRSGRRVGLQLVRRQLQLRRPWLRVPLTLLSLASDPPLQAGLGGALATPIEHGRLTALPLAPWVRHALSAGRRFLTTAGAGKF